MSLTMRPVALHGARGVIRVVVHVPACCGWGRVEVALRRDVRRSPGIQLLSRRAGPRAQSPVSRRRHCRRLVIRWDFHHNWSVSLQSKCPRISTVLLCFPRQGYFSGLDYKWNPSMSIARLFCPNNLSLFETSRLFCTNRFSFISLSLAIPVLDPAVKNHKTFIWLFADKCCSKWRCDLMSKSLN